MPRWLSATVMATVVACGSAATSRTRLGWSPTSADPRRRADCAGGRAPTDWSRCRDPAGAVFGPAGDKRQRFWVHDKHRYTSPWYLGARRKMVAFGCTRAPYYDPDPRCTKQHGFHHGLDLAMPCGTPLYAAYRTRVVDPESAGSLGSAYGSWAFRLRSGRFHKDFVIGHVRRVFVDPGDVVTRGAAGRPGLERGGARRMPPAPRGPAPRRGLPERRRPLPLHAARETGVIVTRTAGDAPS